jgi:hypothetical protein
VACINLGLDRIHGWSTANTVLDTLGSVRGGEYLYLLRNYQLLKKDSARLNYQAPVMIAKAK